LNEDPAAGTTGDKNILQAFFICLNYENRTFTTTTYINDTKSITTEQTVLGLYIQYGIQIYSEEISHLYLSYFDRTPLKPMYYSFGSRNADVRITRAHLETMDEEEQTKIRCTQTSTLNKAIETRCNYKCHKACKGCTQPYTLSGCKECAFASILIEAPLNTTKNQNITLLCLEECPIGYRPDPARNMLCVDIDECNDPNYQNNCQINTICKNTIGSYKCYCNDGFTGNGLFCDGINFVFVLRIF
jgi:hypothetical protein